MDHSTPLFSVPIVSPELSQEEMILQIADSLDYLAEVSKTVFSIIQVSVNNQNARLQKINERADVARAKIDKLTGSRNATKVFSSAKYPAVTAYNCCPSIFSNTAKLPPPKREENSSVKKNEEITLKEKLQFFHVRTKSNKTSKKSVDVTSNGLGPIPSYFDSVGSLLLFNTAEIPYKNYLAIDPMKMAAKTKAEEKNDGKQLDAPPQSMVSGEQLPAQTVESFLYSPSLGEVPGLDLPMDLPDLPGIADDLRYELAMGPGFAPSVASTPALPDLPSIVPELPIIPDAFGEISSGTPLPFAIPPPPPPPPPPTLAQVPIQATPLVPETPPPPPPPPQVETKEPIESKPLPKSSPDDARVNLMDAIRKAGGSTNAKLRSVRVNQDEQRRKDEEKAIAAGGDLMADLHNRLLMRRKGISGDKSSSGSAMDRVSAMIPPPPANQDTSSATEEDDWE